MVSQSYLYLLSFLLSPLSSPGPSLGFFLSSLIFVFACLYSVDPPRFCQTLCRMLPSHPPWNLLSCILPPSFVSEVLPLPWLHFFSPLVYLFYLSQGKRLRVKGVPPAPLWRPKRGKLLSEVNTDRKSRLVIGRRLLFPSFPSATLNPLFSPLLAPTLPYLPFPYSQSLYSSDLPPHSLPTLLGQSSLKVIVSQQPC